MKTAKKLLLMAIVTLLVASPLWGCGSKGKRVTDPVAPLMVECKYRPGPKMLSMDIPSYKAEEDYFSPYNSTVWKERERIYNLLLDDRENVIKFYESQTEKRGNK